MGLDHSTLPCSDSDSDSETEYVYEPLPEPSIDPEQPLTNSIGSKRNKNKKKGKKFVSKDKMLELIEQVNQVQDGKIKQKTDKDIEYLKRLGQIEEASRNRKAQKDIRLNKIKENLRKGGVKVKGLPKLTQDKTSKPTKSKGTNKTKISKPVKSKK